MAYTQKNNPFKKKKETEEEKEFVSFDEKVARSGKDPYPEATDSFGYTGVDKRSIVNPRTYDALSKLDEAVGTGPTSVIRTELMGSEFRSDKEKYRKKYTPDRESALTDFDRAKQAIIDKTNRMDEEEFNSIVNELSNFGSKFKGKSDTAKFATLLSSDLSGMKRVVDRLGISKDQIMDLVKAPENANIGDKLKAKAIRAYLNTQL